MGIKNDLIIKATANNNTKIVKQLLNLLEKLSNSFDIGQIRDKKGNSVLHYAIKNSNYALVKLFINEYKIDINLRNKYEQTPLMFVIGNCISKVDNGNNLSITEHFNERLSRGDDLLIINSLLKSGAKLDSKEYIYLLNIVKNQKNKNEYVSLCENIEETLGLTSSINAKQEEGYEYTEHIYDIPEYTSEHIYEEIDELLDNEKEELSNTINYSNSISSTSSLDSGFSWNDYLQSDGARTPDSGYRSDNQQEESKVVNHQPNKEKPPIAPKPVNLRPSMKKKSENEASNSSFNKSDLACKSAATSIKKKILMFENLNTSSSLNESQNDLESGSPNSKISLDSVKNKNNFSSQVLRS